MPLSPYIDAFLAHCRLRGLSDHTLRAYRQDLGDYQTWLRRSECELPFTLDALTNWIADMRDRGLAPTSVKRRLACLKVLCRRLEEDGELDPNPFHKLRVSIRLPKRFTRTGTAYYNDIELCLKLNQAGYQVWVSGTSTVFHKSSFPGVRSAPYKASPLKADQKGRFMAEFGNLIHLDMASYFDEAFAYFLTDAQPGEGYHLVNMSSIVDADVHIDWFKAHISIDQIISYPTYVRDEIHSDLIGRLPPDLARTHIPLVYFVDRFTALQNNDYWFLTRPQSNDIIVDRNANVMWARDMVLPGT